ncbi:hypothetical protein Bbelb_423300 [Branchiostoma belcheri]|nr:hypothetical protein Bbelb_423300 [Branchiostoma belcheri]
MKFYICTDLNREIREDDGRPLSTYEKECGKVKPTPLPADQPLAVVPCTTVCHQRATEMDMGTKTLCSAWSSEIMSGLCVAVSGEPSGMGRYYRRGIGPHYPPGSLLTREAMRRRRNRRRFAYTQGLTGGLATATASGQAYTPLASTATGVQVATA